MPLPFQPAQCQVRSLHVRVPTHAAEAKPRVDLEVEAHVGVVLADDDVVAQFVEAQNEAFSEHLGLIVFLGQLRAQFLLDSFLVNRINVVQAVI